MIVTKNRPIEVVNELINKGYRLFGENKVQEAIQKFNNINTQPNLSIHLIGRLQTNKVKDALKTFNCIQSIDRHKLIEEILKHRSQNNRTTEFFIQVNIGREIQKSGVMPEDLLSLYDLAVKNKLPIKGFMCIPPADKDPKFYFEKMQLLKKKINDKMLLSMGMSSDYKIALQYGSNLVRVGSLVFN